MSDLTPLKNTLTSLGFTLEAEQPHLLGERHLTRPLGGGHKWLLLGRNVQGQRVVIKASNEPMGVAEIVRERECRRVLHVIYFAYGVFLSPKEILFTTKDGYTVLVTEFVEAKPFLERPLEEQFTLALKAFKAQESAHATTSSHVRLIRGTFDELHATDYLKKINTYAHEVVPHATFKDASDFLSQHQEVIEQYCNFLTHWDLTPQNMRVVGDSIYLLDHSSLHFGNKYEGWARFINFMTLYNPLLAHALVQYVRDNRTPEESLALKCMRLYRLGELVRYYVGWLEHTEGNLRKLAQIRIIFWDTVLQAVLHDAEVPGETIEHYKKTRDTLRSEEEKKRQVNLH